MKKLYSSFSPFVYARLLSFFFCSICCFNILSAAQPQLVFNAVIQNLVRPIDITNAGDGSGRLFILEQDGLVKIYKNGNVLSTPFLNLTSLITPGKEYQGLFSIAFPPDYNTSHFFFVFYTSKTGNTILARYKTSKTNPDVALPASGVELLSLSAAEGNGTHFGDLHFGKDGYLYVMISDVSKPGLLNHFAQDRQQLFGKLLRIDIKVAGAPYYKIPPDNPFINTPGVRKEIWALGFRNAWRWSFDRVTGDTWIADVGEDSWEEVNFRGFAQQGGVNFGWPCYEGNAIFNTSGCSNQSNYTFPVFTYPHNTSAGGFAIQGGYVYRGNAYPALKGYYICADYVSGNAWKIKPNGSGGWDAFMQSGVPTGIVSFGEGEDGEMYAVVSQTGKVYNVQATGSIASGSPVLNEEILQQNKNFRSRIYPTLVSDNKIVLKLKEAYKSVRLIDMRGHELLQKTLNNETGNILLNLPNLPSGMYIVQLLGNHPMQQKIYISK